MTLTKLQIIKVVLKTLKAYCRIKGEKGFSVAGSKRMIVRKTLEQNGLTIRLNPCKI